MEHINHKGHLVQRKEVKEELCRCRMQCSLSMENKTEILNNFYNIPTKEQQDLYLQGLIDVKKCETHRPRNENAQLLDHVFFYHCLNGTERMHVCKTAFLKEKKKNTTERRIRTITDCLVSGTIREEKRGKHNNRNKLV